MKKGVLNFLGVSSFNNELTSNINSLSQIPDSLFTKIAQRERVEIKAKSFPKRKNLANRVF